MCSGDIIIFQERVSTDSDAELSDEEMSDAYAEADAAARLSDTACSGESDVDEAAEAELDSEDKELLRENAKR